MFNKNIDLQRLNEVGFIKISNFLDIENRKKVFQIVNEYKPQKGSGRSFLRKIEKKSILNY